MSFDDIAGVLAGCRLVLEAIPDFPELVLVYFDGLPVPRDAYHTNGWDYDSAGDQIEFYGPPCDRLTNGLVEQVKVIMGCE